jgi:tetratricopeptide (TPR) repeat protein
VYPQAIVRANADVASRAAEFTELIGRTLELEQLLDSLAQARAGHGQIRWIAGEAGIGKSRLCLELAARAEQSRTLAVWGRCWEGEESPAFWPWVQIFRALGSRSSRPLPVMEFLSGPGAYSAKRQPDQSRFRLFDSAVRSLEMVASQGPVLVILEDLHSADRSSLMLLDFVSRHVEQMPVMLVGSMRRPEAEVNPEVSQPLSQLVLSGSRLELSGLRTAEVRKFLERRYRLAATPELIATIQRETGGNPLFLSEVARSLAAEGRFKEAPGGGIVVPEGLRESIRRRLRGLTPAEADLLRIAAVVGREFSFGLLVEAAGLSRETTLELLAGLAAAKMVDPSGFGLGPSRFVHALVRDTVYQDLPEPERLQLHRRVGEALERRYAGEVDAQLDSLAHHFAQSAALDDAGKAIVYCERAGAASARRMGYEVAVHHYRRALGLATEHLAGRVRCFELLVSLGDSQWWAGQADAARESFEQAAEIARQLGDPRRLARSVLRVGETGYGGAYTAAWHFDAAMVRLLEEALEGVPETDADLHARVAARLATALYFSPFESSARRDELSRAALDRARRLGDPVCITYCLNARHLAIWGPDNVEERTRLAGEMVELAHEAGDNALELTGRAWLLADLLELGDIPATERQIELYSALAERHAHPQFLGYAHIFRAMRATMRGSFEESEALSERARAYGAQVQDSNIELSYHIQLAVLRALQGRMDESRVHFEALSADMPQVVAVMASSWFIALSGNPQPGGENVPLLWLGMDKWTPAFRLLGLTELGLLAASSGCLPEAAAAYDQLLPFEGRMVIGGRDAVGNAGPVDLYLGIVAAGLGWFERALAHFERAVDVTERLNSPPLATMARAYLATMLDRWDRPGDRARARELREVVRQTAQTLGMTGWLRHVSPDARPPAGGPVRSVFRKEGDFRVIEFEGRTVRLKDGVGLRHLQTLLSAPGQDLHVLELASGAEAAKALGAGRRPGPVLDEQAKRAYRQRIAELTSEIEEAEADNDHERSSRRRSDLDFLVDELAAAVGVGGRDRAGPSPAERARSAVGKSIHAALKRIYEHHPSLGAHLELAVRTGYFCSYKPDSRMPVRWQV